jgi:hypothetical protein
MSYTLIFLLMTGLGSEGAPVAQSQAEAEKKTAVQICMDHGEDTLEALNCVKRNKDDLWEEMESLHNRILKNESRERQEALIASHSQWIAYWTSENELINRMFPLDDGFFLTPDLIRAQIITDRILYLKLYASRCTLKETETKSGFGLCLPPL